MGRPLSLTSNTGSKATIRYVPFCLSTSIATPFSGCVPACCKRILTSQSSATPMRTRSDITTSVDRSLSEDTWITRPFASLGWRTCVMFRKFFTSAISNQAPATDDHAAAGRRSIRRSPVRIDSTMKRSARKELPETMRAKSIARVHATLDEHAQHRIHRRSRRTARAGARRGSSHYPTCFRLHREVLFGARQRGSALGLRTRIESARNSFWERSKGKESQRKRGAHRMRISWVLRDWRRGDDLSGWGLVRTGARERCAAD